MTQINRRFTMANSISLPNALAIVPGLFALGGTMLATRLNPEARITASQAALLAGVSKQLVNYWRAKGHLTPDKDGKYKAGDVLAVEWQTRQNKQSSRYVERPM